MERPLWQWILGWAGLALLLVTLVFYISSGLLAPGWAVFALMAVWFGLVVAAVTMMRRRKPLWVLVTPVLAALIWLGALTAGERWLGWTG
jgi:hypothetical protein